MCVRVRMAGYRGPLKVTLLGLPSSPPLLLSSECHSNASLNLWLHPDLMALSTENRPCCLHGSTLPCWSLPSALSLFSSVVSPTALAKRGLCEMDWSRAKKKKRVRWIYLYWTLGKNHSVKYATERTLLCWEHSRMAACSLQRWLYNSVSGTELHLLSAVI